MDWRLEDLLLLNNQDFTDEIETLPLHFGVAQWKCLYNDGKEWDRDSMKAMLDSIGQLEISQENHLTQNTQFSGTISSINYSI